MNFCLSSNGPFERAFLYLQQIKKTTIMDSGPCLTAAVINYLTVLQFA